MLFETNTPGVVWLRVLYRSLCRKYHCAVEVDEDGNMTAQGVRAAMVDEAFISHIGKIGYQVINQAPTTHYDKTQITRRYVEALINE
jgi:hypothetical protein